MRLLIGVTFAVQTYDFVRKGPMRLSKTPALGCLRAYITVIAASSQPCIRGVMLFGLFTRGTSKLRKPMRSSGFWVWRQALDWCLPSRFRLRGVNVTGLLPLRDWMPELLDRLNTNLLSPGIWHLRFQLYCLVQASQLLVHSCNFLTKIEQSWSIISLRAVWSASTVARGIPASMGT